MFKTDRIFCHRNVCTGCVEWFFSTREGDMGPYASRETAQRMLDEFIRRCIATGDDGGRSLEAQSSLSLVPMDECPIMLFDPVMKRKGVFG